MNNFLNVALNMSNMSVPQKINRGRQIADAVANHPSVFTNPYPSLATLNSALNDLELAWNDAIDGGKSKTALMHDRERIVHKLLKDTANYVQSIANGDEQIVHLATLNVKAKPVIQKPDFEVFLPDDLGAVGLRCKARAKTFYRWEYCKEPMANNPFVTGNITYVSSSFIGNLESGV
ncbi:MAG: hypothetical protein JWO32_2452, partial [Bacteroidetes bacterium]|nr:hypothetical protein [Bacteroidota bacterium]